MEDSAPSSLEELLISIQSRLDKANMPDEARKLYNTHLVQFTHIAYQQMADISEKDYSEILEKIQRPSCEIPLSKEFLALQVATVFAEGLFLVLLEISKLDYSIEQKTEMLQNNALSIYDKAQTLIIKAFQETSSTSLDLKEQFTGIQFTGRLIVQNYINYMDKQILSNSAKKSNEDKLKTNLSKGLLGKFKTWPCAKSLHFFRELFWSLWLKSKNKVESDKRIYHPAWTLLALFGPYICWYLADHYLKPEYVSAVSLIPFIGIIIVYLRPYIREGLFHLSSEQIFLVTLFSTMIAFASNWLTGIFVLVFIWIPLGILIFDFCLKQDMLVQQKKLDDVKEAQRESINPNLMYAKLGVDALSIEVGNELLPMFDPDQNTGEVLGKVKQLRESLTLDLGFVLHNVRILDQARLEPHEFVISVRNTPLLTGIIYPGRVMLTAHRLKEKNIEIPKTALLSENPIKKSEQVVWMLGNDVPESIKNEAQQAGNVLIQALRVSAIRSAPKLITLLDILKLMEVIQQSQGSKLLDELIPGRICHSDLQRILTNLVRERVSIKDITFIFDRLLDYTRFEKKADSLSERLRLDLRQSICLSVASKTQSISVLELSDAWERKLSKCLQETDYGWKINIDGATQFQLIMQITASLDKAQTQLDKEPSIVCSPSIRLPLFRLLAEDLPDISILASNELLSNLTKCIVDVVEPIA